MSIDEKAMNAARDAYFSDSIYPQTERLRLRNAIEAYEAAKSTEQPVDMSDPRDALGVAGGLIGMLLLTKMADGHRNALIEQVELLEAKLRQPKREVSNPEAQENCPLCKRETKVTYFKSWSRNIDCKGCGFHDFHGILGEPPYERIEGGES